MHRGFVKLWRKSKDSKMYRNHKLWSLWTYILMNAVHKPYQRFLGNQVIEMKPGQFLATRKELATELEMTPMEIRTRLDLLEKAGCISQKSTNKNTLITVVNWNTYQGRDAKPNKRVTNKEQTNNKRVTNEPVIPINKNIKECEEGGRIPRLEKESAGDEKVSSLASWLSKR